MSLRVNRDPEETNQFKDSYWQFTKRPYKEGRYVHPEDLYADIIGGKVFVFKASEEVLACGIAIASISGVILPVVYMMPSIFVIALIGLVLGIAMMFSLLSRSAWVVGPLGIAWRNGGITWDGVKDLNCGAHQYRLVTHRPMLYRPKSLDRPITKWSLDYVLLDGTYREKELSHITHEGPEGMHAHEFISTVIELMFKVYRPQIPTSQPAVEVPPPIDGQCITCRGTGQCFYCHGRKISDNRKKICPICQGTGLCNHCSAKTK